MKMNVLLTAVVAGLILSSCGSTSNKTESTVKNSSENVSQIEEDGGVPYTVAASYFVKNTYKNDQIENLKITTQEEFEKVFGMAATMGADGIPTKIDFSKQYVIAVVGTVVEKETNFEVNSLVKTGNEIMLSYSVSTGKDLSFSIQPSLILILDKAWDGDVKFEKK